MKADTIIREQLVALLAGGNAHLTFEQAVSGFPVAFINRKPPNTPYTPWHLLEHMRIAQWDILEFIQNPAHISPGWPEGYWPPQEAEADESQWQQTIAAFKTDLKTLQDLMAEPTTDLFAPLALGPEYTILREILVVADHNAYHIGEFAILRQVMSTW
jgi:hypothetical protein